MNMSKIFKKNFRFYMGIVLNVVDGMLSGVNLLVVMLTMDALRLGGFDRDFIIKFSLILCVVYIVRLLLYVTGYVQAQFGASKITAGIRMALGDKLKKIPLSNFVRESAGHYINVVTENVNNYEKILTHKVGDIAKNTAFLAIMVGFMSTLYLTGAVIILFCVLLIIPTMKLTVNVVKTRGVAKNKSREDTISDVVEYVSGIQTFRTYGITGKKNKSLTGSLKRYSDISYKYEKDTLPGGIIYSILGWCALPLCIIAGGYVWSTGLISTSAFLMSVLMSLFSGKLCGILFIDLLAYNNLKISRDNIVSVMEKSEEKTYSGEFSPSRHDITFENVIFSYDKVEPVLHDISFIAESGKMTAIVGDSGSGKSTILNLASKYYTADSGKISIGGMDISNIPSEKVLSQVSLVDQESFLFDDTVMNNIRFARLNASDDEVKDACKKANCLDFIDKNNKSFDMVVGENGDKLSGGEKQRLSIARAILRNSPILLLDEATASLDIENELLVRKAIDELMKESKTVVMIAHTLPIIRDADKILVVDEGRIVESGTHDQLLALDGKYRKMWDASRQY